ncbi:MAG: hypothetical protein HQ553_02565 [Chloroflexi bacterium]|nr:hypothetical protein [Chloroflexota bacterium]
MSDNVTERFEHGQYSCQWVDEVPLLEEDRTTVFVPPSPLQKLTSQLEDLVSQVRGEGFSMAAMILSVLAARYGNEIYDEIEKVMYDYGYGRAQEFGQTMKIDPNDARSVGRIFDLEDTQNGIKGEWIETGKQRAVKREYFCPMATAATLCPEICTRVAASVERGTFDGLGVKGEFSFTKLIPKGDPYCEVVIELEG